MGLFKASSSDLNDSKKNLEAYMQNIDKACMVCKSKLAEAKTEYLKLEIQVNENQFEIKKETFEEIQRIYKSSVEDEENLRNLYRRLYDRFLVRKNPKGRNRVYKHYDTGPDYQSEVFFGSLGRIISFSETKATYFREKFLISGEQNDKEKYQEHEEIIAKTKILERQAKEDGICSVLKSLLDNYNQAINKIVNLQNLIEEALKNDDEEYQEARDWIKASGAEVKPIQDFLE